MDGNLSVPITYAFLDGSIKKLLSDGHWIEAASGKTFAALYPATEKVIA
jgi:hypothetical protein